jgi:hypothetical protein
MKRAKEILIGLLWALSIAGMSCATAGPLVLNCGLQDIAILASDYNQIVADYKAKDWIDLAKEAEKVGWATVDCVGTSASVKDPTLAPAVKEFRSLHAVEFRAAGVNACASPLDYKANPGDRRPGAGPASGGAQRVPLAGSIGFSYAGETVAAAAARCDRACGERDAIGSPGAGCLCLRGRTWVASR